VLVNINYAYGKSLLRGVNAYFESSPHDYIVDLYIHDRNVQECELAAYDGIVCSVEEELLIALPDDFPAINLDSSSQDRFDRGFRVDNHRVGELGAEALYTVGALSFLYYDGYKAFHSQISQQASQERETGFRGAYEKLIAEANRPHRQILCATSRDDLRSQLSSAPKPVGVFCFNDAAALEAVEVCRHSGLSVPEDVLLIGVDNDELLCTLSNPWITSIDTGVARLAEQAVGAIVESIESGKALDNSAPVEPTLFPRQSTGTLTARGTVASSAMNAIEHAEPEVLSPAYIAERIGCSMRSLNQLLKGELNRTAQDLIAERILRDAKRLLRETDDSVESIASKLGREPASFHQLFKRYEPFSPGEYRKRFRTLSGHEKSPARVLEPADSTTLGLISPLGKSDRILISGVEAYVRSHPKLGAVRILVEIESVEPFIGDPTYANYTDAFVEECDGILAASQVVLPPDIPPSKPIVTIDHDRPRANAYPIYSDNAQIGAMAARYFLKKGFRNFAYSGYSADVLRAGIDFEKSAHGQRWAGYQAELRRHGFSDIARHDCNYDSTHAAEHWLQQLKKPVALFVFNDFLAKLRANETQRAGLEIPKDVVILGVDNERALCESSATPISSIEIGFAKAGYDLAEFLCAKMGLIKASDSELSHIHAMRVVERESTNAFGFDDPELERAAQFIRSHCVDPISVNDIVAVTRLSRRSIENRAKTLMGMTLHELLSHERVRRATDLLMSSDFNINEVALRSGFDGGTSFCRTFKSLTGESPAVYRKKRVIPIGTV